MVGLILKYLLLLSALLTSLTLVALPAGSRLYPLPDGALHVRLLQPDTLTNQSVDTAIVFIAGPNQNFHADSAWFALLQPLLAKQYRTYAVDRQSSGFSSDTLRPSYRKFATDLARILPQLQAKKFLLVSFASSSITARLLADDPAIAPRLAGLVLIDPDVPTATAQALYNGYPTDWYRANLAALLPELAKGVWNERTAQKLSTELMHLRQTVPAALQPQTDWDYLQQIFTTRQRISRQQARAIEIAEYQTDLTLYNQSPWLHSPVPVSVVDGDFEAPLIAAATEDKALLQRWRQEGLDWGKTLAGNSGGNYLALAGTEHLLMFSAGPALADFINLLMAAAIATKTASR
ncbi:alpha/beta fold hydrolase [Rheinheimera sp.]|uniref:alpha/beta fold hydrolase n=1 Tax=Rheinheimera sp. TaxID=1869214 RepID=UPI003D265865